jgi:hypothetical protein
LAASREPPEVNQYEDCPVSCWKPAHFDGSFMSAPWPDTDAVDMPVPSAFTVDVGSVADQ